MSKTRSDWKRPVLAGIAIAVVFLMIASYGISDFGISQVSVSGGKYKPDALPARSYYVNFTETGLQVGTTWQLSYGTSISFLSNTVYSTNSVISFTETNGTIYFAALEADNPQYSYVPNISSGSIVIDGNNVFVNVFLHEHNHNTRSFVPRELQHHQPPQLLQRYSVGMGCIGGWGKFKL